MPTLTAGLTGEARLVVTGELTAAHYASGLVEAFATPAMVALMENAAVHATRGALDPGQTTVGIHVDVRHLAATPVAMAVRARAELVRIDGRKLEFRVEAWDDAERIGEATHTRMIVDEARFRERLETKRASRPPASPSPAR